MKKRNNSVNKNKIPVPYNKMNSEERIMFMASGLTPPKGRPEEDILNSILRNKSTVKSAKNSPVMLMVRTAAVFFLLVAGYAGYILLSKEKATAGFAERTEITLPDGTNVILNAGSKIVWSKRPFPSKRILKLQGEAFLDVKKGDEFLIKTKNGTVEILGTQLNVFSRDNQFKVTCIEGRVKVSSNKLHQIITPGEMTELTEKGLIKNRIENGADPVSWKEGIFHFVDTPLVSIFAEFERQFNVSVDFRGNGKRLATLDFSNEDMEEALEVVCIPFDLEYEIKNNKKVIIYEKN